MLDKLNISDETLRLFPHESHVKIHAYTIAFEHAERILVKALAWYANGMKWNDSFGNNFECAQEAIKRWQGEI